MKRRYLIWSLGAQQMTTIEATTPEENLNIQHALESGQGSIEVPAPRYPVAHPPGVAGVRTFIAARNVCLWHVEELT